MVPIVLRVEAYATRRQVAEALLKVRERFRGREPCHWAVTQDDEGNYLLWPEPCLVISEEQIADVERVRLRDPEINLAGYIEACIGGAP